jgi:hypothetical protein
MLLFTHCTLSQVLDTNVANTLDDDTLYEATTHTGNELKFVDHNVKQFGTGGYAYSYKSTFYSTLTL